MDKVHYKEPVEKYFEGDIAGTETEELSDRIKNDRQLQNWWKQEFAKSDAATDPILRDKLFTWIKEGILKHTSPRMKDMGILPMIPWR